jgi:hypothetical protein
MQWENVTIKRERIKLSELISLTADQLSAMEQPIFSIDHVQIPIYGDLREAAKWYQNMFGVGDSLPSTGDDCWFAGIPTGRGNLFLFRTGDANSKANFLRDGKEFPVIMFKTFQIDSIYRKLQHANVQIVSFDEANEENQKHFRFLKFYDPWGNMLGFIQDPLNVPWYGTR